ncbi:MAG: VPS10 domain-containing protein, partial [Saprospiraceae bacterium]
MKVFKSAIISLLFWSAFSAAAQTPQHLKSINIRAIGPGAMSGRITAITTHPADTRIIYAGAASGGVWRSKSGGTNWTPIFDKAPTQSVGAIAINPHNPDEIWVGTGEGNPRNSQNFGLGIFRSLDGGETWTCMGLEKTRAIHRILLHRDDPKVIWVAALGAATGPNEDRGVFKSTDGGATWKKVLYTNDLSGCADLVADPHNPNKLFAAMWEYRRWPWFFKSGGAGSGLYVSYDGGENWAKRTDKDGLPEGEIGRIGLAIAPSNPDVVYALVEAKENALYKSTDGGKKWRKMADKNQGDRPFYYHELYVDPLHENTLYSVHSQITKSIDGGRTFDSWVNYGRIHPDHHAFWINPNNPQHIINGNDGGINITYDGGNTWRYAENIPVGQFYHVNVDNELPYNIYGGLQDNGTWVGPSAVWKSGGMRNSEWQEVYFGDGFDAMPQKDNPRYCFAMSQGGELGHIDRLTGETRYIKPLHPEGIELRWNWNAALAQDPFNNQGLYFCSQFVHYSPDLGHSWRLLSPDLTTNDTSKQHQDISGGLTYDATNAENYCTILAVAPSPLEKNVIWIGTDDGNLQLTRDGGKTWENLSG